MQGHRRGQILVARVDDPAYHAIVNVLGPLGFDIHRAPWDGYLTDHVQITPFDVVIVGFTTSGDPLDGFIRALRTRGSACHQSGLIVVAPGRHLDLARRHLAHGANRVVDERELSTQLQEIALGLMGVAPRIPVTTNARIKIHVEGKPIQSFCQTQNLSASGVLIRGFAHYPVGTDIDFEITLPNDKMPIRGSGTISRRTEKRTERIDGLGIRFTSFQGSDQKRLSDFLAASGRRPG
jgi:hypothetical protein